MSTLDRRHLMGPDTLNIVGIDAHLGLKSVGGKRERYESYYVSSRGDKQVLSWLFELPSRSATLPRLSVPPIR